MKVPAKKNIFFMIAAAVLLLVFLTVILLLMEKEPVSYTFAELDWPGTEKAEYLLITDGATGEELTVEEHESIAQFLDILAPLTFQKEKEGENRPGWTHRADFYQNDKHYLRLVFAGELITFSSFDQGEKVEEKLYRVNEDLTPKLHEYFAGEISAKAKREKEQEEPEPAELVVEEIEPAISVVINNHPSARPSSGLQQADTVYEFLVEGGTTRYLAVYKRKHLENFEIGPVRSLRPYFAVQSLEYGGVIAHSGYSARTMELVSGLGLLQIGDVGSNFWRDSSRRAPHNLYTSIDNLYRVALNRIQAVERTYELDQEVKVGYEQGASLEVRYSGHNKVNYIYNDEVGVYYRYINDNPHMDRETEEQYYADRVIIRETSHRNVPNDPDGVLDIELQGSGSGLLYENGRKYHITWENPGRETTYFYSTDNPVEPISGTTWVQVVRH